MSVTTRVCRCDPEDVFSVLADGWSYVSWVPGAARIRAVDRSWPEPGSVIHHSVGLWPVLLDDRTVVLHLERPTRIHLQVRAWPTGQGVVRIEVARHEQGCVVSIAEEATDGPAAKIPSAVREPLMDRRNRESLRRLAYLAERRCPDGSPSQ